GVIEKSAVLMHREFVDVCAAGWHGLLTDPGHAVLFDGKFQTVPVHGCAFRKRIFKYDADAIAARDLNGWAWAGAVVAPYIDRLEWNDFAFERFCFQAKDFHACVELERQVRDIGSRHWDRR